MACRLAPFPARDESRRLDEHEDMDTRSALLHLADTGLLDLLPLALVVCGHDGRILNYNAPALDVWRRTPSGDDCCCGSTRIVGPDGLPLAHGRCPVPRALRVGGTVSDAGIVIERPGAPPLRVSMCAVPLPGNGSDGAGVLCILQPLSDTGGGTGNDPDASAARQELVASVAHELRQALHTAMAALSIMAQRPGRDPGVHARAIIERQLQRMDRLLGDLLDAARTVAGKLELHREITDVRKIVWDVIDATGPLASERNQQTHVLMPDSPVDVRIDPTRIHQVVTNVLANAIKYTGYGGRISITVEEHDDLVRIAIADTGRGIEPSSLPRIFDLFARNARDAGGFGVGLAVAKRLVELHGGTIEARSEGLGHGSEFIISLPR